MYPYGKFPGGGPRVSMVGLTPSSSFFSETTGFISVFGIAPPCNDEGISVRFKESALNSGLTLSVGVVLVRGAPGLLKSSTPAAWSPSLDLTPALRSFSRLSRSICSLNAFSFSLLSFGFVVVCNPAVHNNRGGRRAASQRLASQTFLWVSLETAQAHEPLRA